eukprot:3040311-Rhodomonas_salina.2
MEQRFHGPGPGSSNSWVAATSSGSFCLLVSIITLTGNRPSTATAALPVAPGRAPLRSQRNTY